MSDYGEPVFRRFIAAIGRADTVVEIGCGSGAFLETALGAIPEWKTAFGIDPDFASIVEASARFSEDMRVSFIQADGARSGLRAGCADLALMSKALHHLADPGAVLAEVSRFMKAGGRLVMNERIDGGAEGGHGAWDAYHALRGRIDAIKGSYMRPLYRRSEIDAILERLGFARTRAAIVAGETLDGGRAADAMAEAIRGAAASLPKSVELEAIREEAAAILGRMRGTEVKKPDQYLSEWEKEKR